MLKQDFLIMMEQDLETKNDPQLNAVLDCFKEILKNYPESTDINPNKTVEGCFKEMREFAKKNQKNGCYYFTPKESEEFIKKYLELKNESAGISGRINLADFM